MTGTRWTAPRAGAALDAVVDVPRSKSITNRALLLASLADGTSRIRRPLRARDSTLMVAALRALGADVDESGEDLVVSGPIGPGTAAGTRLVRIDVGNAGTVLRFIPPVASLTGLRVEVDGDPAVRSRPVCGLLRAMNALGVTLTGDGVPFTIAGTGAVRGGEVSIDASSSSQLVSGLLLAAARFTDGLTVRHTGARRVPNTPHLSMTVQMLRDRGVTVTATAAQWRVEPGPVSPRDEVVEPDLSSAAPFLAAAVATHGRVGVRDWPIATSQPGGMLPEILRRFGAAVRRDGGTLIVEGGEVITGVELDLRDAGELTPVVAALACLASTPSRLVGIDYLRRHETDRIAALATELSGLGAEVSEIDDGLTIVPKPMHGNAFSSYDDHRMVMAGAVVGLAVDGVVVDNVATAAKTFPGFADIWTSFVRGDGDRT